MLGVNQDTTITDDSPMIKESSIQLTRIYHVDTDTEDWRFVWDTYNTSPASRDTITLDTYGAPYQCRPESSVLTEQTNGVTVTVVQLQKPLFRHTLIYSGLDCYEGCSLPYTIQSALVDFVTNTSDLELEIDQSSCMGRLPIPLH